jgi:hypothetical protein
MSQLKMWRPASAVACAVLFACAGIAYGGPDWVEGGDDDGNFLPDAGPFAHRSICLPGRIIQRVKGLALSATLIRLSGAAPGSMDSRRMAVRRPH